ncbi:MAG: OadG family protein [Bryobacterales bacterium]|nr:OadG family protein [Bryobacterales bacterium]
MRTRTLILLVLMFALAVAGLAQADAPVPLHPKAEVQMGGPVQLALMLLVVGMLAVFLGLFAIYAFLTLLRRLSDKRAVEPVAAAGREGGPGEPVEISAEMASAIALALFMDLRTFDEGTAAEITIHKITRPFSPWWNAAKTQIIFDKVEMFRRK